METIIFLFLTVTVISLIAIAWDNKINHNPNEEETEDNTY